MGMHMGAQHHALRGRRARSSDGAAAVEFALVSLVFFILLFGIIQYGIFFNDSIQTRQGVREAARQGVVKNFPTVSPCVAGDSDMKKVACNAKAQVGGVAGTKYAKAFWPSVAGWKKGQPLTVCVVVKGGSSFGILPMPNGGAISSMTQLSIEQDATAPSGSNTYSDSLPSGLSWPSGC